MKFDWYQATIRDDPMRVLGMVSLLGDTAVSNDRVGKMYRYTSGFEVRKQGVPVAFVAMGGQGEGSAHAWATSDNAPAFADLVRQEWPDSHAVTRADSCADFVDSTAFKQLQRTGRRVAKDHRISFSLVEDQLDSFAGRTQYLGSPKSEYRGRIYEKGWEVIGKACSGNLRNKIKPEHVTSITVPGIDVACHPSEWVRAELQARPKDIVARQAAAHASPEQLWTFTSWAQDFAKDALALELERFYIRQRKVTTDERALRFMCQQYGNVLKRYLADLGDWDCVGREIGQVISDVEADMKRNLGR
jgi:hypothetical protein